MRCNIPLSKYAIAVMKATNLPRVACRIIGQFIGEDVSCLPGQHIIVQRKSAERVLIDYNGSNMVALYTFFVDVYYEYKVTRVTACTACCIPTKVFYHVKDRYGNDSGLFWSPIFQSEYRAASRVLLPYSALHKLKAIAMPLWKIDSESLFNFRYAVKTTWTGTTLVLRAVDAESTDIAKITPTSAH